MPHLDQWWSSSSDSLRATFTTLLQDIDPSTPLLLLATSDIPYNDLDEEVSYIENYFKIFAFFVKLHYSVFYG